MAANRTGDIKPMQYQCLWSIIRHDKKCCCGFQFPLRIELDYVTAIIFTLRKHTVLGTLRK